MIDTLIRTSALFALVALATFALRNRSSGLRYMLWSFAIVGAVLMPALTKVAPFQWRVLPAAAPAVASGQALLASASVKGGEAKEANVQTPAAPDESNVPVIGNAIANGPTLSDRFDLAKTLLIVWIAGALILLARLVVGLAAVRRIADRAVEVTDDTWRGLTDRAIRAMDVRVPVEVRRSDEVAMPFATGLVRPVIVLPANTDTWNTQQREAVLLHELAHISRGDLAMNILSHVMRAAYWVNPLAWLAAHRLRVEGEKAADDAVLRGGARASDYADHLLSIVRTVGNTVPNVALAMARRSDFEGRLLAILEPGVPRERMSRIRAFGLAALFVAATVPLAAMTRVGAPVATTPEVELKLDTPEMQLQTTKTREKTFTETNTFEKKSSSSSKAPQSQVSDAAVAALAATLTDDQVSVRLAAVNSLGHFQDPAAIAALAKALKEDTDARVREAAAGALGEIDDNRAVPHLLDALKSERVTKVKQRIVEALREIDDPSAVSGIIAVLRDPSPEVRRAAVSALGEFEDQAGLVALLPLSKDDDVQVRREIAQHIGDLESPAALETLIGMTSDADDEVRANAIEQLHHFENERRAIDPMVRALKDKSAHVRQHAADGLGNFHDIIKAAPPALIEALQDPDRDVRRQAANALGNIGDEAAVPGLKKLVSDSDVETRRHAVEALKEIGGADAIQALMGLLKDPDPEVRKTAAEALGKRRGG